MPQAKGPRENGGSGKDKGTASPELAKDRKKKQKRIKETCAQPNKGKKKPCRPCQRIWWSFHKEWHSNMQKKKKEEAERNNE